MSAVPCGRCSFPVEDERRDYVLPRCFACLPPPEPLRVIPTRDQLEAEITRLRAALSEIAALQTEKPEPVGKPDCDGYCSAGQAYFDSGYETGQFKAAEMARKGLVQP